jgi:folate/biopterin transporter
MSTKNQDYRQKVIDSNKLSYLIISFSQGITSIADLAVQFYFKDVLLLQPAQMSLIFSLLMLPWVIKPLLGLLTDLVPIFGFRRKVYIMLCGLASIMAWLSMAFIVESVSGAIICLFINSLSLSFASVLGEAIVVELSNIEFEGNHEKAKNYVSLFFLCKHIGILIASFFKGFLLEIMTINHIFLLSCFVPVFIFFAGLNLIEIDKYYEYKETLLEHIQVVQSKKVAEDNLSKIRLIKEFFKFIKRKEAYIPAIYVVILFATPNFGDTFFYYMTNFLGFQPVQLGLIALATTIGVLTALISYRAYFKTWSFKLLVTVSTFLYFVFTFLCLILVLRYNLIIGIPDLAVCIFGYAFLSILGELSMLPMLSLACMICPKSLEGTVYSFFMSSLNLGQCLSTLFGASLTSALGITATDFTRLPHLIMISNLCNLVPILVLYFIDDKYLEPKSNIELDISKDSEYLADQEELMNNESTKLYRLL